MPSNSHVRYSATDRWRLQRDRTTVVLLRLVVILGFCSSLVAGKSSASAVSSAPPDRPFSSSAVANGTFVPVGSLKAIGAAEFTTLTHPTFPNSGVRIKESLFCDAGVRSYTGYFDHGAKHLFFYFFESRGDPFEDDIIYWTNGGPGGSSALGLFMELGPCRVTNATKEPAYHPESWNTNANALFVDQPVGTGFSYADHGEYTDRTEQSAKDVAIFMSMFFENFNSFKGSALHMAGESYAGRSVPLAAAAIYDQNAQLVREGLNPINLSSVIIGSGYTHPFTQMLSFYDFSCTPATISPFFDISTCARMKHRISQCKVWFQEACLDQFDFMNCKAARTACITGLGYPFFATGRNQHDVTKICGEPGGEIHAVCYDEARAITEYLNRRDVRKVLGVDPSVGNFSLHNMDINNAYELAGDQIQYTTEYVAALLEHGIPVLVYVGTYDYVCNWVGNQAWTRALEWSGQEQFSTQPLREWIVDGKVAGQTRSAKGFTYATVNAAGHMVPFDKPVEALALISRWLAKEPL